MRSPGFATVCFAVARMESYAVRKPLHLLRALDVRAVIDEVRDRDALRERGQTADVVD